MPAMAILQSYIVLQYTGTLRLTLMWGRGAVSEYCWCENLVIERREVGTSLNYSIVYTLYLCYSGDAHRPCLVLFGSNAA